MSTKKVPLAPRTTLRVAAEDSNAENWVATRDSGGAKEPEKRLTIDIPEGLHRAVKAQCALDGTTIAAVVRDLLTHKYGNQ